MFVKFIPTLDTVLIFLIAPALLAVTVGAISAMIVSAASGTWLNRTSSENHGKAGHRTVGEP